MRNFRDIVHALVWTKGPTLEQTFPSPKFLLFFRKPKDSIPTAQVEVWNFRVWERRQDSQGRYVPLQ